MKTDPASQSVSVVLKMKQVSKRYPGTLAVDRVDFEVFKGEVHAIVGENGAGKSTLMKILAGSFRDYTGQITIQGRQAGLYSPQQAKSYGIEMIYQELSLAQPLTIAENILAGRLPVRGGIFLDREKIIRETRKYLQLVGLDEIGPMTPVEQLSQHEAQLVEIAKALSNEPKILVMDEPTSALSQKEVARLFEIIARLKNKGITIIYISHHLSEIFQVADRVTVMRDGKKVDTMELSQISPDRLVEMMLGKPASLAHICRKYVQAEKRFSVRQFSRWGFFHNISFEIHRGEILGIGGLAGSGRSELARSLCGIDPFDTGEITLDEKPIIPKDMQTCIHAGLGYMTEDRKLYGLALKLDAQTNITTCLNVKQSHRVTRNQGRKVFRQQAEQLNLYPAEPGRQIVQFSGGNQQKALLAKWLALAPEVLIADEPTRGVDVGAKQVIHEAIVRLAEKGKCILLISSDLPELVTLADRVMIMRKGRFIKEMQKQQLSDNAVLLAANGEMSLEGGD